MPRDDGGPRKPTSLKPVECTARADRLPEREPKPKAGVPKPPGWLSPLARRYWRETVAVMREVPG